MSEPTLESLRAEGVDSLDPMRFHYLQILAARLPGQPEAVQRVLAQRLQLALGAYAERASLTSAPPCTAARLAAASPLAQLNQELKARARADADRAMVAGDGGGASASDMKSVRQFGEVWLKIAAERQVTQALNRGPENAGPLNPHKLMLRTFSLMRGLSPDYLRHFLSQMDALLWLEQAQARPKPTRAPPRPGRGGRPGRG